MENNLSVSRFMEKAAAHVSLLQKHEKAPAEVSRSGKEGRRSILGDSQRSRSEDKVNNGWDTWFADVELAEKKAEGQTYGLLHGKSKSATGKEDEELLKQEK